MIKRMFGLILNTLYHRRSRIFEMATTEHRRRIAWHVVLAHPVERNVEIIGQLISRLLRSSAIRGVTGATA